MMHHSLALSEKKIETFSWQRSQKPKTMEYVCGEESNEKQKGS